MRGKWDEKDITGDLWDRFDVSVSDHEADPPSSIGFECFDFYWNARANGAR